LLFVQAFVNIRVALPASAPDCGQKPEPEVTVARFSASSNAHFPQLSIDFLSE
jgi:hypothetical protein